MLYSALLGLKFLGVVLFGGGLVASACCSLEAERKRVVRRIAAPGLMLAWICGYLLAWMLPVSLVELWTLCGLFLPMASMVLLERSLVQPKRVNGPWLASLITFTAVLIAMVFRPSWSDLQP